MKKVLLCFPGERYKWAPGRRRLTEGVAQKDEENQKGEQDITATPMPPKAKDETTIAMEIGIYFANEMLLTSNE